MYRSNTYFSIGALTLLLTLLVGVHVGRGHVAFLKERALRQETSALGSGYPREVAAVVGVAAPFVSFPQKVMADAYARMHANIQEALSVDYSVASFFGDSLLSSGDRGRLLLTPQFSDAAFVRNVALPVLSRAPELTAQQIVAVGGVGALAQTAAVVDSTNKSVGGDAREILSIDAQAGSILLDRAYSLFTTGAQNAAVLLSDQFAQLDSFNSSFFQDNTNYDDATTYYQPDFQPQNTLPAYQDPWVGQDNGNTGSLWGGYTPDKTPQVPTVEAQNGGGTSGWSDWQPNTGGPGSVENQNGGSGATDPGVPAGNTSGFTVAPEVVQGNNNPTDSGSWSLLQPSSWSIPFLSKNSSDANVTDQNKDSGSTDSGSWWSGAQNTITNFFSGSGNTGYDAQRNTNQNAPSNNSFFGSYIGQIGNSVVNFFSAAPSFWSGGTNAGDSNTGSNQPDSNAPQSAQPSAITEVAFDGEPLVGKESGFINAGFTKGAQCTLGYENNEFSCGDPTSLKSFTVISGYSTFDSYLSKIRLAARTQSNEQQYLYIEKNGKGTWYLLPEGDTTSAFIHCGPLSEALGGNPTRVVHIHTHPGKVGESVPPSLADAIAASMMKGMFGSNKIAFMVVDPTGNNWTYDTTSDFTQKFKNAYFCGNNDADVVASFRNKIVDAASYEQYLTLQGGRGLTPGQLNSVIEGFRGLGFIVNR